MSPAGAWSFQICVYLCLLSHLSFFSVLLWVICLSLTSIPFYIHYLHPPMADKVILTTLPKLNESNWFEWKKEAETFLLLAGLDAEEIPTGAKAVMIGLQMITKHMCTISSLLSQITVPLLLTSDPVEKLGQSLLRRTVPQHAWYFANNYIHSCMIPLLVLWCSLMPFFQLFNNSALLVINWTTSKLLTSS